MPRKTQNINSLSRGYIRASMNKYNLFNLYKKSPIRYNGRTLYQQKWTSKAETRAYHGEHLTESRWKTIFNPSLETVAQLDASLKGSKVAPTPMALQTYASLEKRLEFAIFRAMFASSVRQAREFIIAGNVKVNGVTIKHPSFPLRGGDVFSVDPEKVLYAMGRKKPSLDVALKTDTKQIITWNKHVKAAIENPRVVWELMQAKPKSLDTINSKSLSNKDTIKNFNVQIEKNMKAKQKRVTKQSILGKILRTAKTSEVPVGAETFVEFGSDAPKCNLIYQKLVDSKHSLIESHSHGEVSKYLSIKKDDIQNQDEKHLLRQIKLVLGEIERSRWEQIRLDSEQSKLSSSDKSIPFTSEFTNNLKFHPKLDKEQATEDETKAQVDLPWQRGLFGRKDPSKPYFTPWNPRPFIGCFAILPAHLEISFKTCHAVYLRDPIARPGQSEVITPFPDHVHERAYMHYVRKGM
ncbi:mitochondrial 37S ribosomal protein NAM9 [Scheffersomyces coipomensis]|uniref:mitochondrial 37S ribosomal protein NAM9 n=1 Tax=Scheffersomyces coipomensis TaxID=1788519 RepID=UPI00315D268D